MRPPTWCPSCNAEVEPAQDFCMECGEPIAQVRSVGDLGSTQPAPAAPASPVVPTAAPSLIPPTPAAQAPTAKAVPKARRRYEEPEPVRCPGCGIPSLKARCPGCGVKLRDEDA